MGNLSNKAVKVIEALLGVVAEHARGERDGVSISTVELNSLLVGATRAPFNDYDALREATDWCEANSLPALALMLTYDEDGIVADRDACKLVFRNGVLPSRVELKKAVAEERAEIAAMDGAAVDRAKEALQDAVAALNASKGPTSRRALANAQNQEIEARSWDEWIEWYRNDILGVLVPDEPLVRNRFLDSQEGYKDKAWDDWKARAHPREAARLGVGDHAARCAFHPLDNWLGLLARRRGREADRKCSRESNDFSRTTALSRDSSATRGKYLAA